jgi:hypothetical protein
MASVPPMPFLSVGESDAKRPLLSVGESDAKRPPW